MTRFFRWWCHCSTGASHKCLAVHRGRFTPQAAVVAEEVKNMAADIPGNLIRLAVGGEYPDDVVADLDQALAAIGGGRRSVDVPAGFSVGGASRRG